MDVMVEAWGLLAEGERPEGMWTESLGGVRFWVSHSAMLPDPAARDRLAAAVAALRAERGGG